jgi:putative ABC transport system permease protein
MEATLARPPWPWLTVLCLVAWAAGPLTTSAAASEASSGEPPAILVSRQLLKSERLKLGDMVSLSGGPSGANPRAFRIVGSYEPTADPARLGDAWLEARLHLPDLIDLVRDPRDPEAALSAGAINVRLADRGDALAFAREVSARVPGLVARSTAPSDRVGDPFVVLDRFHLAIALVTVIASSLFLLALMVMLVDERRDTVTILRLIGLRRRRILLQVLFEGTLIALAGAGFGVALAAVLESAFNRFFQWRYDTSLVFVHVTAAVAWRSVLIAVPLGILASLLSSWSLLRREDMARR